MFLSRPARFPLLKLPWLCIESVIKNWNVVDLIFFALISKKTRQIVKSFRIPLSGIQIFVLDTTWISLCGSSKIWDFSKPSLDSSFYHNSRNTPLLLQNNPIRLYTRKMGYGLETYTNENEITALKMAMEFLNEVFKCTIETVTSDNFDNFPESGDIGVKSTVNLYINVNPTDNMCINQTSSQSFGYAQSQKLSLLLENLEVTGTCDFCLESTDNDFYVDPKLFKCKKLVFSFNAAAWVTRETLLQFEVPQLKFEYCPFSVEDILSFVTHWFHSDNKTLEYLYIGFRWPVSLDEFQTSELKLVPFSERNRVPLSESFRGIDFSKGLEIVRHDGLEATIHLTRGLFVFYIWHNQ
ncbi:unnamed protein product [Caenorhabditis brenneri]